MDQVKALLFDVFGTVVDWRGSVTLELEALGKKSGILPGIFFFTKERTFFFPLVLENFTHHTHRNHELGKVRTRVENGLCC